MFEAIKRWWKGEPEKAPEIHLRIGRLTVHHILCAICQKPLLDGELILWEETEEGRQIGASAHAACRVPEETLQEYLKTYPELA